MENAYNFHLFLCFSSSAPLILYSFFPDSAYYNPSLKSYIYPQMTHYHHQPNKYGLQNFSKHFPHLKACNTMLYILFYQSSLVYYITQTSLS